MRSYIVDSVNEQIVVGDVTIPFDTIVNYSGGVLKDINDNVVLDNNILNRITISEDGTKALFDGVAMGLPTASQVLAELPEA
jgi:hypothetical protein